MSAETRELLVAQIDEKGPDDFTREAIAELEKNDPELLHMAHNFALREGNYLHVMQGFWLLYKSLLLQARAVRGKLH